MVFAGLCIAALASSASFAAVQRSFNNGSFEVPALTSTTACFAQVPDSILPGWQTSHGVMVGIGTCPAPIAPGTGKLIELWANGWNGVFARSGKLFAELNAEQPSTLSQTLCINNGERVAWSLSHRGRAGVDQMHFYVGADPVAGMVLNASTGTSGNATVNACQSGTSLVQDLSCTSAAATSNGTIWGDYSGAFTWNGASGERSLNFGAISTANGDITVGNFLDNISIRLTPYVELSAGAGSGLQFSESAGSLDLGIKVSGELLSPHVVSVSVIGGTATLGVDYKTPNGLATFDVVVPAGDYDGTGVVPLGITVLEDTLIEGSETIRLQINPNPAAYLVQSTSVCGGVPNADLTFTILDNDGIVRPLAANDSAVTNVNTTVVVSAWANDTAPSGSILDASTMDLNPSVPGIQTTAAVAGQGTFTSHGDGTVAFSPVAEFTGVASVPYVVADSRSRLSNLALITVTVRDSASSSTPVANNDVATTISGVPVDIAVLNNDAPGVGNALNVGSITLANTVATQGSWSADPVTGVVSFIPAGGFAGTATATYTVTDSGTGISNFALISVNVSGTAPVATAVPTLSQWALISMATALMLIAAVHMHRSRTRWVVSKPVSRWTLSNLDLKDSV